MKSASLTLACLLFATASIGAAADTVSKNIMVKSPAASSESAARRKLHEQAKFQCLPLMYGTANASIDASSVRCK